MLLCVLLCLGHGLLIPTAKIEILRSNFHANISVTAGYKRGLTVLQNVRLDKDKVASPIFV